MIFGIIFSVIFAIVAIASIVSAHINYDKYKRLDGILGQAQKADDYFRLYQFQFVAGLVVAFIAVSVLASSLG